MAGIYKNEGDVMKNITKLMEYKTVLDKNRMASILESIDRINNLLAEIKRLKWKK